MSDIEEIIENTKATMAIEGMELSHEDISLLRKCLSGDLPFEKAVAEIIAKYKAA